VSPAGRATRLLLVALLACDGGDAGRDEVADVTDSVAEPAERPAVDDDPLARFRSRLPEGLLRREGACPFECCGYRTWSEPVDLALLSEPRTGQPVDTIPAGERFEAETGIVFVTGLMLALPADTLGPHGDPRPEMSLPGEHWRPTWLPGDTLVVLDYVGEGAYNVWEDGEVAQVSQFWESPDVDLGPGPLRGTSMGEHETEWWVKARRVDGTVGWFQQPRDVSPEGADLCG
jgi:hypothetical protein